MRRPYIHFFHIRCFSRDRLLSITAISLTTEIGKSAYRSSDNPEVGLFGVKLTYNGRSALLPERVPTGWAQGSVADCTSKCFGA